MRSYQQILKELYNQIVENNKDFHDIPNWKVVCDSQTTFFIHNPIITHYSMPIITHYSMPIHTKI